MGFVAQEEPLWQEFRAVIRDEGLDLYDLETAGRGALKVTLCLSDGGTGVTSGDCSRICRRLMVFCLAEGQRLGVSTEPEIDVSSPGLDRSLRLPEHWESAVGKVVKCVPAGDSPWGEIEGKPIVGVLRGELESFGNGIAQVREERTKQLVAAPIRAIKRANVEFSPGEGRAK